MLDHSIPTVALDTDIAAHLRALYHDAQIGLRRVVAFGLFAWEIKETVVKHGQFGPWLAAHCPELARADSATGKPKPTNALNTYMDLTKSVLEQSGFTVEKYLKLASNSLHEGICRGGNFLLVDDEKLPEPARKLKTKICDLVDGKTQRQLMLEFKQTVESNGKLIPARGNLSGKGNPKSQRVTAQALAESARLEIIANRAGDIADWLIENSDDKHLGLIPEAALKRLQTALETSLGYLRRLNTK